MAASLLAVAVLGAPRTSAQSVALNAHAAGSLKFGVVGDHGTGEQPQYEIAGQMALLRQQFPFEFVLMLGDNLYGSQDFAGKFERPFKPLLDRSVRFYATLGNHDSQAQRSYAPFNMGGERYYTFARQNARFIVLDTNILDARQLEWLKNALAASREDWTIVTFHHPLYSNAGRHGSSLELRVVLEPILVQYHVDVVLSGHDHVYERLRPQKGITYFVAGSGGKLARGDVKPSSSTAAAFDSDQSFMLVEIAGNQLFFHALSRGGQLVDSGTITRNPKTPGGSARGDSP
jgi:3',5'-cyclic AMP phosphodiesterase CpdA